MGHYQHEPWQLWIDRLFFAPLLTGTAIFLLLASPEFDEDENSIRAICDNLRDVWTDDG
jgi:hypothetical protein